MKKFIYLLLIGLALTGALPGNGVAAKILRLPLVMNNYCPNQHLSFNFLAFGDSITGCYYDSYFLTNFPYCGYERRVYEHLQEKFDYCWGKLAFYNKSEGGETTIDGLARFYDTIVFPGTPPERARLFPETAAATNPDLVIIMEGTNDMNQNIADFVVETNLRTMVSIALSQGKRVILATIPPAFGEYEVARQERIANFNPVIHQIGLDMGIPIADVYSRLFGHPEWAAEDGLHLNDAGFDQIADVFYQTIVSLLGLAT